MKGAAALALLLACNQAAADPERRLTRAQEATLQGLAGVGAAVVTIPSMMAAGAAIGRSSNDLSAALVPSLLLQIIVPPVAVTLSEWAVGRYAFKNGSRIHPAIWLATGVNLLAIIFGSLGGVWTDDPTSFSLFVVIESLALPAATSALMDATRRPRPNLLSVSF